ncbi:peptidase domain-containing ABC transporter [Massilia sp. MB5]|uniref:peptidase domain-containing ABC transporter n=1 Tax=Massilia sp. MB5 TaxID=2919578 RepID=UPI001F117C08|nr:peptidase domain-containing ABC transporter [Massilia sp. MB5]UMR29230.1 peptidase domain-containing ABC transporter [Massilia sp. MB5]
MKLILQAESRECGLACLAMIASHHGHHVELPELRRKFSVGLQGSTLNQLMRYAGELRLSSRPLRVDLGDLDLLQLPCIAHWDMNHFVVIHRIHTDWRGRLSIDICDPAAGQIEMTASAFSRHFTGNVLELMPLPEFQAKAPQPRVSISELLGKVIGIRRALAQILLLALALEVFSVVSPLFSQYIIDDAIVAGNQELLTILLCGFLLILATRTAIDLARSWFLARWRIEINFQWAARVFSHLTRLPASYFERRHVGDVASRFASIGEIQNILTNLLVESLLDGLMALLALGMMLMYSPKLTAVVMVCIALYGLLRWAFYGPLRRAAKERLLYDAREQSNFLETIRAITPLKLFGREADRCAQWQNLKMEVANRDAHSQWLGIVFKVATSAISGIQHIALFYLGANLVIQNTFTVGMLMAITSYASTFSSRIFNLIDTVVNVRMLSLHTEYLADIVLEAAEAEPATEFDTNLLSMTITLRGVRFRYADNEPWILNGIDLEIPAGQSLALIGSSGCGKTTLCKIIMGLLEPTEGEVYVGHIPVRQLGLRGYRRLLGSVTQHDTLLAGSILDNISFFDSPADLGRLERCARLAAIHDDILAMPMAYYTMVGDMGSSLSGGQKQRILLARALYKQPRILTLDEATSHLDIDNERKVNAALSELKLTRVIVAHRPDAINAAERVVAVEQGLLHEIRNDYGMARSG